MRLIGITGFKGSGKSEIAKYLETLGYIRVSFADPLKNMLKAIGLTDQQLYGDAKHMPSKLLCGETPRHAMQTLGTEWGRLLIHNELWTNLWWETARPILAGGGKVVTDDLRFPNEANVLVDKGGQIWRINRHDRIAEDHQSEILIDSIRFDAEYWNDGTIEELQNWVRGFFPEKD